MNIHDFSKALKNDRTEEALRRLREIEDPKVLRPGASDDTEGMWPQWMSS